VWEVALNELAARYGGVLSQPARVAMVGTSSDQTMALLHADLGQPWRDPAIGAAWLDDRVKELFAAGIEWRPGARELLLAVRAAGIATALVTNTNRALVDVALLTLGARNFDVTVCGDEVARTKPDPEPYLVAAAALGVPAAACVAVEDSPAGVASAVAAGCAVIAVPNEVALTDVDGLVLSSLVEADLDVVHAFFARSKAPLIDIG
jgi:HAD superfamily hydrolase (TIGR01509 family)